MDNFHDVKEFEKLNYIWIKLNNSNYKKKFTSTCLLNSWICWKLKNFNQFYYRHNKPGEDRELTRWTNEKTKHFMKHLKKVGLLKWGLFSKDIAGIYGYRCNQKYVELLTTGHILDINQFWDCETEKFNSITSSKRRIKIKFKKNYEKLKRFSFYVRHDPRGIIPDNFTHPEILPEIKVLFDKLMIPSIKVEPLYRLKKNFHEHIVNEFPQKRAKKGSKKIKRKEKNQNQKIPKLNVQKMVTDEILKMNKEGLNFVPEIGKRNLIQNVDYGTKEELKRKYIKGNKINEKHIFFTCASKHNVNKIYSFIEYHNEFFTHLGPFLSINVAKKHTEEWLNTMRCSFKALKTFVNEKWRELPNEKMYNFCRWVYGLLSFKDLQEIIPDLKFNKDQWLDISTSNSSIELDKLTKEDLKKIFSNTRGKKKQSITISKAAFNATQNVYKFDQDPKKKKKDEFLYINIRSRHNLKSISYCENLEKKFIQDQEVTTYTKLFNEEKNTIKKY